MYDCGDGFYGPKKRTVIDYDHAFLRNTGYDEVCQGSSSFVSFKVHFGKEKGPGKEFYPNFIDRKKVFPPHQKAFQKMVIY